MIYLGLVVLDKKIFESENLFFDPVTYLCNQSEQKQFWYGTIQESFLVSLVKFPLAVQEKLSFELEKKLF